MLVAGFLAAASVGGCDPFAGPEAEIEVVIGAAHFEFGERIGFEVRNRTSDPITYFTCPDATVRMGLLRRVAGEWHAFGETCPPREEAVLAPGRRIADSRPGIHAEGLFALRFEFRLDPGLVEGSFRVEPIPGLSNSGPFHVTP